MKLQRNAWAIRWRHGDNRTGYTFHADVPRAVAPTARDAVLYFASMFPNDIVVAVQDEKGRFA